MKKNELKRLIREEYKRVLMEARPKKGRKATLMLTIEFDGNPDKNEQFEVGTFNAMGDAMIARQALQKIAPKNYEYWIK